MHVMVVNNLYPPIIAGGAERIVTYLCEDLVRRGHRVTVVSTCGPEMEPYPTEIHNGVEVIRFFPPNLYWSHDRVRKPGFRKWLWHARDAWNHAVGERFEDILKAHRPDIVHTHLIDGFSATIWAAAKDAGIPVVHTAHDYHLMCPRAFMVTHSGAQCAAPRIHCRLFRKWHLHTTRYVDSFTSPSRFLLDMHLDAGLRSRRHMVIYNGTHPPQDSENVRKARAAGSNRRFVMLSRLTTEKGIQVVLDAVARLPQSLQIEVVIAGTGPLENVVREAAVRDSRISFAGFVDGEEKARILSRAGYLLLPSLWYENAPVTIIEAAAYGLGLIASDIGAIPEFVERDQTGFLFPPGDAAALADLMHRASQNTVTLPRLETRTQALAKRLTVERMVDSYEAEYAALSGARRTMRAA